MRWGSGSGVLFVVLYCNFRSLAFLGLLGFLTVLTRQQTISFIATLLSAAKFLWPSFLVRFPGVRLQVLQVLALT